MIRNRATTALLALALLSGAGLASAQYYQGPPPRAWEAPPAQFIAAQQRGYHDGVEGARKDFDNHRPSNVNNRDEYRHPHVSPSGRDDYREGFRRGYDVAMNHLLGH